MNIKKIAKLLALLILLTGSGLALYRYLTVPRQEGIARLTTVSIEPFSFFTSSVSRWVSYIKEGKPAAIVDFPAEADASAKRTYFEVPIGKHTVFAVIEALPSGQVNAWLDTNMDMRFSDEQTLTGQKQKYTEHKVAFVFGPVRLASECFTSEPFYLTCYADTWCRVYPTTCRTGKIRLANQVYQVALIDGDYDGRFATVFSPSDESLDALNCDAIYMDSDKRKLPRKTYKADRLLPLGSYLALDEKYYRVLISEHDQTVTMTPSFPPMGTLQIAGKHGLNARLLSDTATQTLTFEHELQLPAGRYQMHWGRLSFADENLRQYELLADFRKDIRKGQFEIKPGETCTINPGPPFTIRSDIHRHRGDRLAIGAVLVGREGETYGLRIARDMPEPTLRILDENDAELHAGTMEYG